MLRKSISAVLICAFSLSPVLPAKEAVFGMKYEGGSLPLNQHDKLKVAIEPKQIILTQGKQRVAVPVNNITEVSYGNDVHRRVGAAIGVGLGSPGRRTWPTPSRLAISWVVTLGIGALMLLVKTKKHYVGMTWADKTAPERAEAAKGGVVFNVGKGDYRGFLSALEGTSGLKAVER